MTAERKRGAGRPRHGHDEFARADLRRGQTDDAGDGDRGPGEGARAGGFGQSSRECHRLPKRFVVGVVLIGPAFRFVFQRQEVSGCAAFIAYGWREQIVDGTPVVAGAWLQTRNCLGDRHWTVGTRCPRRRERIDRGRFRRESRRGRFISETQRVRGACRDPVGSVHIVKGDGGA